MTKKDELKSEDKNKSSAHKNEKEAKEHEDTIEEKLKKSEEKLLRALAETENQRKDLKKKLKMLLILVDLILQKKLFHYWIIFNVLRFQ